MTQLITSQKGWSTDDYAFALHVLALFAVYLALETTCLYTGNNTEFPINICNLNLWKKMLARQSKFCFCTNMFTTPSVCCSVVVWPCNAKLTIVFVFPTARMEYIDLVYAVWDIPVFTHHRSGLACILGPYRWPGDDFSTIRMFSNS